MPSDEKNFLSVVITGFYTSLFLLTSIFKITQSLFSDKFKKLSKYTGKNTVKATISNLRTDLP